jgi:pentatricopeptide repeat protein
MFLSVLLGRFSWRCFSRSISRMSFCHNVPFKKFHENYNRIPCNSDFHVYLQKIRPNYALFSSSTSVMLSTAIQTPDDCSPNTTKTNDNSSNSKSSHALSILYTTKIKEHKQKGDYLGAVSVYEEMCAKGIQADRFHYSIMIPIYTYLEDTEGLSRIIEEVKKRQMLSEPIIFNQILLSYLKLGKYTDAFHTLEEYVRDYKLLPEDKHIRSVLKIYLQQNAIDELLKFVDFVRHHIRSDFPDTVTYAIIFSHFYRQNDHRNASLLFQKLGGSDIQKEKIVLRYLFKIYSNLGKVHFAEETFQKLPNKDINDYNALLRLYVAKGQIHQARNLLEQMKRHGIGLNCHSYNLLLEGYSEMGDTKSIHRILDTMSQEGIDFDQYTYNILIRHFMQFGDHINAFKLSEKMKKDGLRPFPSTYIYLLRLCSGSNNKEKFNELYNELIAMDFEPNQITFQTLLSAEFSRDMEIADVIRLFNSFKSLHVIPNVTTYNTLLKIFLSKKEYILMEEIFNEMIQNKVTPNLLTLNLMMELYLHLQHDALFLKMFDSRIEYHVTADAKTYNLLLEFHLHRQNFEQFIDVLTNHFEFPNAISQIITHSKINEDYRKNQIQERKESDKIEEGGNNKCDSVAQDKKNEIEEMRKDCDGYGERSNAKISPTMKTYNLLIRFYGIINEHQKATEIFNILFESSETFPLRPDNDTFNALIETSSPENVVHYWESMKSKYRVIPDISNYLAMLQFCARINNVTLANSVLQKFFNANVTGTLAIPSVYVYNVLQGNKHPVSKRLRDWLDKLVKNKVQQNCTMLTKNEVAEFEEIVFLSKFKIASLPKNAQDIHEE